MCVSIIYTYIFIYMCVCVYICIYHRQHDRESLVETVDFTDQEQSSEKSTIITPPTHTQRLRDLEGLSRNKSKLEIAGVAHIPWIPDAEGTDFG